MKFDEAQRWLDRADPQVTRDPSLTKQIDQLKAKAKEGTLTRNGAAAWYAMVQELRRLADYYERDLIRQLRADGKGVILISHKLNEVTRVADRVTVLRDGRTVETVDCHAAPIEEDHIIRRMVGRAGEVEAADRPGAAHDHGRHAARGAAQGIGHPSDAARRPRYRHEPRSGRHRRHRRLRHVRVTHPVLSVPARERGAGTPPASRQIRGRNTVERPSWAPDEVDITAPSVARVYDYFLGGSHNFASDRAFGKTVVAAYPAVPAIAPPGVPLHAPTMNAYDGCFEWMKARIVTTS